MRHAVTAAQIEELAGAAHVRVEALCLGAAEVAHGAEMHDRIRLLLAQRVLEGARADVGPVERDARGPALPVVAVDPDDAQVARQPPREQASLPARDPDDQDFFHATFDRRWRPSML